MSIPTVLQRTLGGLAALLIAGLVGAQSTPAVPLAAEADARAAHIQRLAEEAYIFGLPIVMNYAVLYSYVLDRESSQFKAPFGQWRHYDRVFTHEDTAVVTPNSDTPYSFAALDLRTEPYVVSVPPVASGRYYSLMLCDASTHNFGLIGSIATRGVAGDYLIVGPDWRGATPPGIRQVFRAGSALAMILVRTQLHHPADMPQVKAVQASYGLMPLSRWAGTAAPTPAPAIDYPAIDAELAKKNFFATLDFMLRWIPATPDETEIRAKLAELGLGVGDFARFKTLAAHYAPQLQAGAAAGERQVAQYIAQLGRRTNGWNTFTVGGGDRARYAGNWLARAAVAKAGIYALDSSEAQYSLTRIDGDGQPLDGSAHTYRLTFAAGQLPPADAFWSLTLYDGRTQLLIDNQIKRYLINSPMLETLRRNADGSLTLYIQHASPGTDKESNWLPAPAGPIYLALRLYGPQAPALDGRWQPPAVTRAN